MDHLVANILSPPVLAFLGGIIAVNAKSDLKIPDAVYQLLTIYLLLAIGYKGGVALRSQEVVLILKPVLAGVALGAIIPVVVFWIVRWLLRLSVPDAAALAAHYGSVSAVTFISTLAFLDQRGVIYEGYLAAVMAVMEIPAILVSLLLARLCTPTTGVSIGASLKEVLSGKSLLLLFLGLVFGGVATAQTQELLVPFFISPFYGVLILFLLELGLVAGDKLREVRAAGPSLLAFAVVAPVCQGMLGLLVARWIGLSAGGGVVLAILAASASYIAAPAAVRVSLPEANPAYYVTCSLGITFPFNLLLGIPFFYSLSGWMW